MNTFDRVNKIDWFAHVGEPLSDNYSLRIRAIESWQEALDFCNDIKWEVTETEARNELTRYLDANYNEEYQSWNVVMLNAKECLSTEFLRAEQIIKDLELPKVVCDSLRWAVLAAVMEEHFGRCNPPIFFQKLLRIYEDGHFPCGWEGGEWPIGTLLVY